MQLLKSYVSRLNWKIIAGVVVALNLSTVYNACSKVGFQASPSASSLASSSTSSSSTNGALSIAQSVPSVSINGGAPYTNDVNVMLALQSDGATETYITNDSGCTTGGTWEPYVNSHAWVLAAANNSDFVYAKFRKVDQSESICASAFIVHDNLPPDVAIDVPAPAITNKSAVNSTFHATDSGSGVDQLLCILPGQQSASPCAGQFSGTGYMDGSYKLQFLAVDKAGNTSAPIAQNFVVDTTPPTIMLNSTPPIISASSTAAFGFTGMDSLSGIKGYECKLDLMSAYAPCMSGQTYTGLAQGNHAFAVHAVDNAGNISADASYNWEIDSSVPMVQFTQTPSQVSNSVNATFAFTGQDSKGHAITQFKCRLNGGAFAACTSPDALSGLKEGKNSFGVIGTNALGVASSELVYSWTIDLTPPVITITQGPLSLTNSNNASFAFTVNDNLTALSSIHCSVDGAAAQDCSSLSINYANLMGDVQHSFQVIAVDGAGNQATSAPYLWFIDNTPPVLKIVSAPDVLSALVNPSFQILGTDAHGPIKYECKLDSAPVFTACAATVPYTALADGTHMFYAQAFDAAGNVSSVVSYKWTIETTGPKIVFTQTPNPTILTTDKGVLSYTVTDALSTVTANKCMLDSTMLTCADLNSGTLTFSPLAAGNHVFTLTSTNALGQSSSLSYNFMVRAPVCTTTLSQTKVLTKMLFVVDMSGSNQSAPDCTISANCTDPGKKMRAGSIQTFFNDYGPLTNFAWAFDTFAGTTSTALINSGVTTSPIFAANTAMQPAIDAFKKMVDNNATPYMAALNLATTAISKDPDLNGPKNPQYIVVFMSDGMPNEKGTTTAGILNQVNTIVGLSPGRISVNTIYYGPVNATASGLLQSMATTGNGNFLNTNTNPTGLDFQISNNVNVPVTTCQ